MNETRVVDGKTYRVTQIPYVGPDPAKRKARISSRTTRERGAIKRSQGKGGATPR